MKKYVKGVLFKADFVAFGPKKRSLRRLLGCKTHLTVIIAVSSSPRLVPMQIDPSAHILGTQNAPKKGIFWPSLPDFETNVRHLCHPFPAATVKLLAHILCDCSSDP